MQHLILTKKKGGALQWWNLAHAKKYQDVLKVQYVSPCKKTNQEPCHA